MSEPTIPALRGVTSLRQDLRSGAAGPGVRLLVSLALAALVSGLAAGIPYLVAVVGALVFDQQIDRWTDEFGQPGSQWGRVVVTVNGEIIVLSFLLATAVYVALHDRLRPPPLPGRSAGRLAIGRTGALAAGLWRAVGLTALIWLVTGACIAGVGLVSGPEQMGVFAAVCLGTGATLLVWVDLWRRYGRGRPALDADGQLDVRCPACRYSMIGLYDAHCPECGQRSTLGQLLRRQGFEQPSSAHGRGAVRPGRSHV